MPNDKLWRYMDFPKFMSLLTSKALYFANAVALDDPFEGSIPRRNIERLIGIYTEEFHSDDAIRRNSITTYEAMGAYDLATDTRAEQTARFEIEQKGRLISTLDPDRALQAWLQ